MVALCQCRHHGILLFQLVNFGRQADVAATRNRVAQPDRSPPRRKLTLRRLRQSGGGLDAGHSPVCEPNPALIDVKPACVGFDARRAGSDDDHPLVHTDFDRRDRLHRRFNDSRSRDWRRLGSHSVSRLGRRPSCRCCGSRTLRRRGRTRCRLCPGLSRIGIHVASRRVVVRLRAVRRGAHVGRDIGAVLARVAADVSSGQSASGQGEEHQPGVNAGVSQPGFRPKFDGNAKAHQAKRWQQIPPTFLLFRETMPR